MRNNLSIAKGLSDHPPFGAAMRCIFSIAVSMVLLAGCGSSNSYFGSTDVPSSDVVFDLPGHDDLLGADSIYEGSDFEVWLLEQSEVGGSKDPYWRCIAVDADFASRFGGSICRGADHVVENGLYLSSQPNDSFTGLEGEPTTLVIGWVPERFVAPLSVASVDGIIELVHVDDHAFLFEVAPGENVKVKATGQDGEEWEIDWIG